MEHIQKPSVSSLPTVFEVEGILIGLLNINNVTSDEESNIDYDEETAIILSSWVCDPQRTPEEIYELIGPKFEKLQGGTENKLTQSFLSAVVLDALGVISEREEIVLIGHWAKITWYIIKYLYKNNKGEAGDFIFHPGNLHIKQSNLIVSACNTNICPDDALRLELFGLIWAKNHLWLLSTEQMVEFFVQTISELDYDIIYSNHAHDLLFSTGDLWVCFDRLDEESDICPLYGVCLIKELIDTGQKITESLLYYEYSREVKFLQNILKLTRVLAQLARFRFQSKSRLLRKGINDCLTLFISKFIKFFKDGMKKFAQICLHPFINPYYIDLVDIITNSILDLSGRLNKWRKNGKLTRSRQNKFRKLETRRNYMVYCINSVSPPMNLPPLLLKQELGLLKPSGIAELQRKVFNYPRLPLSFNYSDDRVDFSKYKDQAIDDNFFNMDDENDDESDDERDMWEIYNVSENYNSDESSENDSENASDETSDLGTSDTDDTQENLSNMMRMNDLQNGVGVNHQFESAFYTDELVNDENEIRDDVQRVINAVQNESNASDSDDASINPSIDEDDNDCMVQ